MSTTPPWEGLNEIKTPAPPEESVGDTMAEYWRDVRPVMKKASSDRRAANRENSAALLSSKGIEFTTNNDGIHLMVSHAGGVIDFWPGTGRWRTRTTPVIERRGVHDLISYIEKGTTCKRSKS